MQVTQYRFHSFEAKTIHYLIKQPIVSHMVCAHMCARLNYASCRKTFVHIK